MKLFATGEPNNTLAKTIEVFTLANGNTFIQKTMHNGRVFSWEWVGSPAEWVAFNNSYRKKWNWYNAEGVMIPRTPVVKKPLTSKQRNERRKMASAKS